MKDSAVTYFRCPYSVSEVGSNGVRMEHKPSGAVAQACDKPSREDNEVIALERLVISEKYKTWRNSK